MALGTTATFCSEEATIYSSALKGKMNRVSTLSVTAQKIDKTSGEKAEGWMKHGQCGSRPLHISAIKKLLLRFNL